MRKFILGAGVIACMVSAGYLVTTGDESAYRYGVAGFIGVLTSFSHMVGERQFIRIWRKESERSRNERQSADDLLYNISFTMMMQFCTVAVLGAVAFLLNPPLLAAIAVAIFMVGTALGFLMLGALGAWRTFNWVEKEEARYQARLIDDSNDTVQL